MARESTRKNLFLLSLSFPVNRSSNNYQFYRHLPALAPIPAPATKQPSISLCGSCLIISLSLQVPGSPSSAFTTRYFGLRAKRSRFSCGQFTNWIEIIIWNESYCLELWIKIWKWTWPYDHFIDKVNEQSIMSGHHKVLGSIPGQASIFKISTT